MHRIVHDVLPSVFVYWFFAAVRQLNHDQLVCGHDLLAGQSGRRSMGYAAGVELPGADYELAASKTAHVRFNLWGFLTEPRRATWPWNRMLAMISRYGLPLKLAGCRKMH